MGKLIKMTLGSPFEANMVLGEKFDIYFPNTKANLISYISK